VFRRQFTGGADQQPMGCAFPRSRGGKSCVKRREGVRGDSDGGQREEVGFVGETDDSSGEKERGLPPDRTDLAGCKKMGKRSHAGAAVSRAADILGETDELATAKSIPARR
jgi:hypothetical protein